MSVHLLKDLSGKGVKMSTEFYEYATDKIKTRKSSSKKENKKVKTKQTQDLPELKIKYER
jgi:hypothetical protein